MTDGRMNWEPVPLTRKRRYSRNNFQKILSAVGIQISWNAKLQLRRKIEAAAEWFEFNRAVSGQPTASELVKRMGDIERTVTRLMDLRGW